MPKPNRGAYLSDEPNEHGVYEIRWTENGRSRRKSTGVGDRKVAQRIYAQFLLVQDEPVERRWTAGEALSLYKKEKGGSLMGQGVFESCYGHVLSYFGDLVCADITVDDVERYGRERAAGLITWKDDGGRVRGGRECGPAGVRRELSAVLIPAMNYAIKVKKMPAGQAPYIPLPPESPAKDRWLSMDEARALLDACQPDKAARLTRVYRFTAMALYTASRKQPILTLPWSRIDLEGRVVDLQDPARRRTKKRRGKVAISDELAEIIKIAEREKVSQWWLDKPTHCQAEFEAAVKRAGLEDVTPHTLRHTWATWAAQRGVPILDIAGVLHDSVATVEKKYIHHCPTHLRTAVNATSLWGGAGAHNPGVTP